MKIIKTRIPGHTQNYFQLAKIFWESFCIVAFSSPLCLETFEYFWRVRRLNRETDFVKRTEADNEIVEPTFAG